MKNKKTVICLIIVIGIVMTAAGSAIFLVKKNQTEDTGMQERITEETGKEAALKETSTKTETDTNTETDTDTNTEPEMDIQPADEDTEIAKQVMEIQETCNMISSGISTDTYEKQQADNGITAYFDQGELKSVVVAEGAADTNYKRSYCYKEGKLIYSCYSGNDVNKFYFDEAKLIRWRYSPQNGSEKEITHDMEPTKEYMDWEKAVLEEGNSYLDLKQEETAAISNDHIINIMASSSLSEYGMIHLPERAVDNSLSTAWVEGADGQGIGESLTFEFDMECIVNGFIINAGYQKSEELYWKNSRPKELRIEFADGSYEAVMLEDINGQQDVRLKRPVKTKKIVFIIDSVNKGEVYEDTAISEVALY